MSRHGEAYGARRRRYCTTYRDGSRGKRGAKVCIWSTCRLDMRAPTSDGDRLTMPSYSTSLSNLQTPRSADTIGRPSPKLPVLPPHPRTLHLPTLPSTRSLADFRLLGSLPLPRYTPAPPFSSGRLPLSRRNRPDASSTSSPGNPLSYPTGRDGRLAEAAPAPPAELARHAGTGLGR